MLDAVGAVADLEPVLLPNILVDLDSGEFLYDAGADALTLVTCWPFGAIDPRTPYRYLVTARRIGD